MTPAVMDFGRRFLTPDATRGKRILEVGSRNVNGSLRELAAPWAEEYIGVDIEAGRGVDVLMPAGELPRQFAPDEFDIVISTEMLEHVEDWRAVVAGMKYVCGDLLLVTTCSRGFKYHEHPIDAWRYELADFERIFADFETLALERTPREPGVMYLGRKRVNLRDIELYRAQPTD